MSVSSSIDFKLLQGKENQISPINVIQKLLNYGWTLYDKGKISYLPIGDNGDFEWQWEDISLDSIMQVLSKKEHQKEVIGIVMTWRDTGIGGTFLFWTDRTLTINLTINRKMIVNDLYSINITDINWYLEKLLPVFHKGDILIDSFTYQEHV